MIPSIQVAAVALNQTPMDWHGNHERIMRALWQAREKGASLVCFPELCLTGYGCEDAFFSPDLAQRAWALLEQIRPLCRGQIVIIGLPVIHRRALYNAAAVIVDGAIVGLTAKQNLAGDGVHYEPRWFKPWPAGVVDRYRTPDGRELPIGDLIYEVGGIRIGFEICEDAWVAERPGVKLAARAVDVILNPSASHFAFGKSEVRRRFVSEGSRAFGVAYVYSNLLGNEAGRMIYDGQLLIADKGEVIAESERFGFIESRILTALIEPGYGRVEKIRAASFRPQMGEAVDQGTVRLAFNWPVPLPGELDSIKDQNFSKEEEFTHAVALGLFDYARKSGSHGFVVSLSGGADSAAVSCLVHLMAVMAKTELGELLRERTAAVNFQDLLLTVYQATENSGEVTRDAAHQLAEALQAKHLELDLQAVHQGYLNLIESSLGEMLNWSDHDLSLQNIQARVRAPGAWMYANLRGAILLTTSNRSEAAVGYATMDGDTAGGLAPIAGIDKAFLRHWLRWLETTGPRIGAERFNIPALAGINRQIPTAELRPAEMAQSDEKDLMPYEVLDEIERAAIREHRSPAEVLSMLSRTHQELPREQLVQWVKRFFTLWSRNQWKRERYAPGFHLDDENLDPKSWCRWPILSGGFQQELEEL